MKSEDELFLSDASSDVASPAQAAILAESSEASEMFTHTVHCYDDKSLRQHFSQVGEAAWYANDLLTKGHRVKVFDYNPEYDKPKRYVDIVAERGIDG